MALSLSGNQHVIERVVTQIIILAAVISLVAITASGGAVAHADGNGLTVHNQTVPLDQHGEIHTVTIDKASADTDFYVDLHTENGTINTTQTFEAGTTREDFEVTLSPTIKSDTEVTVATHAANGTELASETIAVDTIEAPTVSFSDQVHQLDVHDEIHDITVDTAAANEDYYVDVHTADRTINTTQTFNGGTAQTDLELTLNPTLTETTNVTAAVHAANGTELAAETATVATADVQFSEQSHELDEHGEIHQIDVEQVAGDVPYYVDVHTANGTINTTRTFEAGTTVENLELTLSPTITSDTNVTVALHTEDGAEIAASTATVTVMSDNTATDETTDESGSDETTDESGSDETTDESGSDETTDESGSDETATSESTPGFGVIIAIVALLGAALLGRQR
ncbi:PGF-CTERM sorting domain-containing protein [Halorubrum yunnanense]|uniref:PGF-CTERM sorting domain-containing protein n=1 Tax=Halorubrum yunnanense TaxID=1526162 RepID=A0ABD5Y8Y9_9EURY|nr:PGF-CTERM sorting domain-containing protein [Halorubrum yunnanense]